MANWYTDNILGNDTTGDGSIANPYKTIAKVYTVCANNDVIYVAGSTTTPLPGTISQSSNEICNTTDDLTGLVAPGDVVGFSFTNYYGIFWATVRAVTPTTISLATNMIPFRDEVMTLQKVNQLHYYTASTNTVLENITTTTKTGIEISGGWNSTFDTQDGYTWMVYHSISGATSGNGLSYSSSVPAYNIKLQNFAFAGLANPMGASMGTASINTINGPLVLSNCASGLRGTIKTENSPSIYTLDSSLLTSGSTFSTDFDLSNGQPSASFNEVINCSITRRWESTSNSGNINVQMWYAVVGNYFGSYPSTSTAILGTIPKVNVGSLQVVQIPTSLGLVGVALSGFSSTNTQGVFNINQLFVSGVGPRVGLATTATTLTNFFDIGVPDVISYIPWTNSGTGDWFNNGLNKGYAMIRGFDGTAILRGFMLYQSDATVFDTGINSLKWLRKRNVAGLSYPDANGIDNLIIGDFILQPGLNLSIRMKLDGGHTTGLMQFKLICLENNQVVSLDPGVGFFGTDWVTYTIPLQYGVSAELDRVLGRHVQLAFEVNGNQIDLGITAAWFDSVEIA